MLIYVLLALKFVGNILSGEVVMHTSDFDESFDKIFEELAPIIEKLDLNVLAKHDAGWTRYTIENFMTEKERYRRSYNFISDLINERRQGKLVVLDVGTLIGILPLMLTTTLPVEVHTVENFNFYGEALEVPIRFMESKNIVVHNVDVMDGLPFENNQFDVVLFLAVIEHLPFSPAGILAEMRRVIKTDGYLLLDTPNVASLYKRVQFFWKGNPPYPLLEDFYFSEILFTGHHREYTLDQLRKILQWSGFRIKALDLFNVGDFSRTRMRSKIIHLLLPKLISSLRNYIWLACEKHQR